MSRDLPVEAPWVEMDTNPDPHIVRDLSFDHLEYLCSLVWRSWRSSKFVDITDAELRNFPCWVWIQAILDCDKVWLVERWVAVDGVSKSFKYGDIYVQIMLSLNDANSNILHVAQFRFWLGWTLLTLTNNFPVIENTNCWVPVPVVDGIYYWNNITSIQTFKAVSGIWLAMDLRSFRLSGL